MENAPVYTPQNILITGGAGFIASHVVIELVKKYPQYRIVNMDCLDYCATLNNLSEIENYPNYKFVKGNIRSAEFVRYVLMVEKIDTVMHFAAQSHVDNSFGNSLAFTYNNVVGTHVLLEASKQQEVKRFIHVSTDEVYGEQTIDQENVKEESLLNPTNPYAATKAAAEFIVKGYQHSFKFPAIITRSNNVYGPHQYPEKVIPKFINLLERKQKMTIHGSGENMRSFLYVKDLAKAFDLVLHHGVTGGLYNIGSPNEITINQVARMLFDLIRPEDAGNDAAFASCVDHVRDRSFNDFRYAINDDRVRAMGWRPSTSFEDGLKETLKWYQEHPNHWGNIEDALKAHPTVALNIGLDL